MEQINLTFNTKNIDPKDHILSVFIEADSFVYGVFDKKHKLVASANYQIDLLSDNPLAAAIQDTNLGSSYYKTIITYSSREFVHLNKQDFEAGDFEVYFNESTLGEELLTDKFTDSDVHVVYKVNTNLRRSLIALLAPSVEIHISTAMRQYIYPSQSKKYVALITSSKLHYMSYSAGQFQMYNAYAYHTKEDFLYYLQLANDFVKMDNESATLEVGGWLDRSSEMYKFVSPYYRHIDWVNQPSMTISSSNKVHQKHHFFALYASILCVL